MYFSHFFSSLTKRSNIPVVIYLLLNVLIITTIVYAILLSKNQGAAEPNVFLCFFLAILFYFVSILIALSPVGEWILRKQTGCKEISRKEQIEKINPIFQEVYAKAKEKYPVLPDDITLYVKAKSKKKKNDEDEGPNAFAAGRKTICVTESLLYCPEDQIKAVLAHEFGHLAHHDTDVILVITVGNFIITAFISIVLIIGAIIKFIFGFMSHSKGGGAIAGVAGLLITVFFVFIINMMSRLWSQIGVWLCMKSSRDNEYLADEFSFELGYGASLCAFLDDVAGGCKAEGVFAALASSHPDTDDRISRLQSLGCDYKKSYGSQEK